MSTAQRTQHTHSIHKETLQYFTLSSIIYEVSRRRAKGRLPMGTENIQNVCFFSGPPVLVISTFFPSSLSFRLSAFFPVLCFSLCFSSRPSPIQRLLAMQIIHILHVYIETSTYEYEHKTYEKRTNPTLEQKPFSCVNLCHTVSTLLLLFLVFVSAWLTPCRNVHRFTSRYFVHVIPFRLHDIWNRWFIKFAISTSLSLA